MSARAQVWAGLREVTRTGMTVLTSATDPPSGDVEVIRLPAPEPDHRPTKVLDRQGVDAP